MLLDSISKLVVCSILMDDTNILFPHSIAFGMLLKTTNIFLLIIVLPKAPQTSIIKGLMIPTNSSMSLSNEVSSPIISFM